MAEIHSPIAVPLESRQFEIGRTRGGDPVLYADNDKAFRVGCAAEAVKFAVSLLAMLQRERRRAPDVYEFEVVFDNTMSRVVELLSAVNIGHSDDEIVTSEEIANTVFGEGWLIGERRADGSIVPAGSSEEEASHG